MKELTKGRLKNMKKMIMTMVLGALMAYLVPVHAQNQQWQSTSTMQGTGSNLAPQVTAVGATSVSEMAATTSAPVKAPNGPRRGLENPGDVGQGGSPIGDAIIPLLLMSFVFCGVIALRRKRNAINN